MFMTDIIVIVVNNTGVQVQGQTAALVQGTRC
jgi:hypothetical protein